MIFANDSRNFVSFSIMSSYSVDCNFVADLKNSQTVTLSNDKIRVTIAEYGLYLLSLESADRNGKFSAVNLNYGDELSKYVDDTFYLCCLAGR